MTVAQAFLGLSLFFLIVALVFTIKAGYHIRQAKRAIDKIAESQRRVGKSEFTGAEKADLHRMTVEACRRMDARKHLTMLQ